MVWVVTYGPLDAFYLFGILIIKRIIESLEIQLFYCNKIMIITNLIIKVVNVAEDNGYSIIVNIIIHEILKQ